MPSDKNSYISPLSTRYASKEMQHIFSENFKKILTKRHIYDIICNMPLWWNRQFLSERILKDDKARGKKAPRSKSLALQALRRFWAPQESGTECGCLIKKLNMRVWRNWQTH